MKASSVRILLVDDFLSWHTLIQLHLQPHQDLQVVAVAADGYEAVQKAAEFQPDLVLLDVRLPRANGIEVAAQILERAPRTTILFLSETCDPDIVEAALAAGGSGYVAKNRIARDLLIGISSVLRGELFITPELKKINGSESDGVHTADGRCPTWLLHSSST